MARVESPDVRGGLEVAAGGGFTEEGYRQALTTRGRLRDAYTEALRPADGGRLDAYPTVPLLAPSVGDDDTTELNGRQVPVFLSTILNTGPGSTAGMPDVSLPAGATDAGLPIGISLEALPGEDAALLAVARQVEHVITPA
jgi:Asp-tRNA(Asn)/Glu-tRNA(Gln) amidotransferase A subunit family amidase